MVGLDLFQLPFTSIAISTTAIAVLLYGIAARMPSPVPPVFIRLLAVWLLVTSTTLQAITGTAWWHAALLGGGGLALIGLIYLAQTRRKPAPTEPDAPQG